MRVLFAFPFIGSISRARRGELLSLPAKFDQFFIQHITFYCSRVQRAFSLFPFSLSVFLFCLVPMNEFPQHSIFVRFHFIFIRRFFFFGFLFFFLLVFFLSLFDIRREAMVLRVWRITKAMKSREERYFYYFIFQYLLYFSFALDTLKIRYFFSISFRMFVFQPEPQKTQHTQLWPFCETYIFFFFFSQYSPFLFFMGCVALVSSVWAFE